MNSDFSYDQLFVYSSEDEMDDKLSEREILVENKSGVCVITLNRPKKYNAISVEMRKQWTEALINASTDDSISLCLITGNGDYYCSGSDLGNFERTYQRLEGDMNGTAHEMTELTQRFVSAFIDFPKPLIGAINGPAYGIAVTTLALMDCVIASDSAIFQTPFSSLGLSPEGCSTHTFPLIMGTSKASEMLYFNHKMSAKEALECGLVSRIVESTQFRSYINEWLFGSKGIVKSCYPKSMQSSKALVRNEEIRNKLHKINRDEMNIIRNRWISSDCHQVLKSFATRKSNQQIRNYRKRLSLELNDKFSATLDQNEQNQ